jgi:hypothetical protein
MLTAAPFLLPATDASRYANLDDLQKQLKLLEQQQTLLVLGLEQTSLLVQVLV